MEKQINIPKLRFPEFKEEWGRNKFGEVCQINPKTEKLPMSFIYIDLESVVSGQLIKEETTEIDIAPSRAQRVLCKGDVLFQMVRPYQQNNLYFDKDGDYVASTGYALIKTTNDSRFIYQYLHLQAFTEQVIEKCTGTSYPAINSKDLSGIHISIPSIIEQSKIALFLTSVDDKLAQLKKKRTLLEQYKKGVMQKIFSQELRFKDNNGECFDDWEVMMLGEVAKRITSRNIENNTNVLTISAQSGLVSQLEFFNKSVSAKDVSGYYLLSENDFAYNKSYSKGYPMGAIKRLTRYEKGVVSTLYICFRFSNSVDLSFMEHYFETGLLNSEIEKVAQEGARNHGLLNIGVNDFFGIYLYLPTLSEQTKIANFLSAIEEKINLCSVQIEKMASWKKGLMQQMFC